MSELGFKVSSLRLQSSGVLLHVISFHMSCLTLKIQYKPLLSHLIHRSWAFASLWFNASSDLLAPWRAPEMLWLYEGIFTLFWPLTQTPTQSYPMNWYTFTILSSFLILHSFLCSWRFSTFSIWWTVIFQGPSPLKYDLKRVKGVNYI